MTRPARTSKTSRMADSYAADICDALQRRVRAVVDRPSAGSGVKKNVRNTPVSDQDHEAVEGDLAEHERPVVREDLVERACGPTWPRRARSSNQSASRGTSRGFTHGARPASSVDVAHDSVPIPEAGADRAA